MTEHAPERIWSSIDIPKTIAGVLAAVSAAVVGSFLGVAGTLAGAALASIVGSVGTEVYHRLVDRGHQKIKSTFVTAPAAVGTPAVAAAEDESPSFTPRRTRWSRVALVAGALFVLAMGTLTAFELVSGKSAADAVGHSAGATTTVGQVLGGDKKDDGPAPSSTTDPADNDDTTDPANTGETPAPGDPTPTTDATAPADGSDPQPTDNATTGDPATDTQQDAETENADGTE
jgi:hypothetical protein